jgi:hypothetical protein
VFDLDNFEILYILNAFLFQIILIGHFGLRKWRFKLALQYGPIVYALSIPAAVSSIVLMLGEKNWALWLGGFLYLVWAMFGYTVEYLQKIEWRNPIRWSVCVPYVILYLAAVMFYWWPLALLFKPLWYGYAILFGISTILNVASHH